MVTNWLSKPFPFVEGIKLKVILNLIISLVVFFVLFVFRPFGLHIVESRSYFIGLSLISFAVTGIHLHIFPLVFPTFFDSDKWSIFKQIVFIVSIIGFISIINYFYNGYLWKTEAPQFGYLEFIFMTSCVGVTPSIVMIYFFERYATKKNIQLAEEIILPTTLEKENTLTITPDTNQHEQLSILQSAFLYAESDKNYCMIYYFAGGEIKKQLMRMSLKNLVQQLMEKPQFLRCHKSYVINKEHIIKITGNARSLVLKLKGTDIEIPVSRSLDKDLLI